MSSKFKAINKNQKYRNQFGNKDLCCNACTTELLVGLVVKPSTNGSGPVMGLI